MRKTSGNLASSGNCNSPSLKHNEELHDASLNGARKFMGNIGPWNGHRLYHGLFGAQQKHEEPGVRRAI
jgi:hypothetical protein